MAGVEAAAAAVAAVAVVAAGDAPGYEVLDAFGGLARLSRRSPTLDGSVSLRATQGCVPLLEGNELGHQVVLTRPLRVDRSLGRWRVREDETWAAVERARRAALPMLRARGLLPHDGWSQLDRGVLTSARGELRLWTGLCVRPRAGAWILITSATNRRNRGFEVRERVVPVDDGWVPLWLELRPAADVRTLELHGEVACLVVVEPGLSLVRRSLAQRPEAARGHLRFYAQDYFEAKKRGEITRRYRKTIDGTCPSTEGDAAEGEGGGEGGREGEVVEVGPCPGDIEVLDPCLLPTGPAACVPFGRGALSRMRFDNPIDFTVRWDGHTVALGYDRARLRALTAGIEPAFAAALGAGAVAEHPGALLYLTKLFTSHPPGEPHFFLKPWALTMLPPGWSALIDGVHDEGYDVMRGVVHADQFFATPAVFQLFMQHRALEVPVGRPLLRVTPVPRRRLRAPVEVSVLEGIGGL